MQQAQAEGSYYYSGVLFKKYLTPPDWIVFATYFLTVLRWQKLQFKKQTICLDLWNLEKTKF